MRIGKVAVICMFFIVTVAGSSRASEPELAPRSVLNGTVVILVPTDFELMSKEMARLKYPSERRPPIVFTNYDGTVNITVKPTDQRMSQTQIPIAGMSLARSLKSAYPSQSVRAGIAEVGGREIFLVDMRTPALDTEIRNLVAGASVEDRLVMFSFNVTRELEAEWIDVGKHILTSITFAD